MKSGRTKPSAIEARRLRVAELMLAKPGISITRIAREIGCSTKTAWKDMKAVREEWAARRVEMYETQLAEDLRRTDEAIAALWPKVLEGKGWAIDRLVGLLGYRARILGVEAQKHHIDVGEVLAGYLARIAEERDGSSL